MTESRQDRVSFSLRKIAEYSREIVSDKDNPLEYELYSTIVTNFMRHIENLERERFLPKTSEPSESVFRTNDRLTLS
jgi:hypothetical protein